MYYRGRGLSDQRPIQYGPDRPRAPSPTTKRVDAHARTKYTSRFPPLTRSKAAAAAAARRPDPAGLVEEQDGIADERRGRARHVRFVPPLPIPLPLPLPLRRVVPCIPRSPNPRAQFLGRTARFGSNHVSRGEFERLVPWGARLGGSRFRTQPARGVGGRSDSLIFPSPPPWRRWFRGGRDRRGMDLLRNRAAAALLVNLLPVLDPLSATLRVTLFCCACLL